MNQLELDRHHEFRELWARHDVRSVSEGRKTMHHPLVGELAFDFDMPMVRRSLDEERNVPV
jgi:hypothetical protein